MGSPIPPARRAPVLPVLATTLRWPASRCAPSRVGTGLRLLPVLALAAVLAAGCGGNSGGSGAPGIDASGKSTALVESELPDRATSATDATRLLQQASFGPSPQDVSRVMRMGAVKYIDEQLRQPASHYVYALPASQYRDEIHRTYRTDFCSRFSGTQHQYCWRDWYSHLPVQWDFFRQAVSNPDQLRQRVAFALSQVFVVSAREVHGSYAIAQYQQLLRDHAFDNFRTLLEKTTLSPVMGEYLNLVNNDGADPNENYARELLQLFSIGTCRLNADGSLVGGQCESTYDNETVREYAYALSGWTYPAGGVNPWCGGRCEGWENPVFYRGEMQPIDTRHDGEERRLLSGVVAPAGRSARDGLSAVLDSIMAHDNVAPFIGRQLIQFLVTSNPEPAYIERVSQAFNAGRFQQDGVTFGNGARGDMQAVLAAILLDESARNAALASGPDFGRLREPVMMITGAIRALDGQTDGVGLGEYGWARQMGQSPFYSPSVFNFYSPMQPLNGTDLVAPRFGIDNANTNLSRINFANALVYWWYRGDRGKAVDTSVAGAFGTRVSYTGFEDLISQPEDSLVALQALNELLVDGRLSADDLEIIRSAMDTWTSNEDSWLGNPDQRSNWRRERIRTAVYLILSSPQYQVQR